MKLGEVDKLVHVAQHREYKTAQDFLYNTLTRPLLDCKKRNVDLANLDVIVDTLNRQLSRHKKKITRCNETFAFENKLVMQTYEKIALDNKINIFKGIASIEAQDLLLHTKLKMSALTYEHADIKLRVSSVCVPNIDNTNVQCIHFVSDGKVCKQIDNKMFNVQTPINLQKCYNMRLFVNKCLTKHSILLNNLQTSSAATQIDTQVEVHKLFTLAVTKNNNNVVASVFIKIY